MKASALDPDSTSTANAAIATLDERWRMVRERLAIRLDSPDCFDTWYAASRALGFADGCLRVGVPSVFIARQLRNCGGQRLMEELASAVFGEPVRIELSVDGALWRELQRESAEILAGVPRAGAVEDVRELPAFADTPAADTARATDVEAVGRPVTAPVPVSAEEGDAFVSGLPPVGLAGTPDFRFDTMVEASENRLAFAAARQMAEKPGEYSLLILHGRAGTGKTHLLHALCHDYHLRHPERRVACVSAREWVEEFSGAFLDKRMEAFRRRYRGYDLLAVDDVQVLASGNKVATQEEFAALLDTLTRPGSGRQVALAGDRPPSEWPRLSEKLRSRLAGGLVAGVEMPGGSERVALARRKASERGLELAPEVARVLADGSADVRALEGAVTRLAALVRLGGGVLPNIAGARLALRGDGRATDRRLWTPDDVAKAVCEEFGVRLSDLRERKRIRTLRIARSAAVGLARSLTGESLNELGLYFGGRSHATMLSLIRGAAAATLDQRGRLERVLARLGVERRLDDLLPLQGELFSEAASSEEE